ncbi:MAG: hypothetical protein KIT80_16150 [Chitinophagaceae bacterium]|nr:hypothetical protein [Chitinophagaceae bacterium]MCW5928449.1 hypothetical protein [Chitinophagaceae bacterium]
MNEFQRRSTALRIALDSGVLNLKELRNFLIDIEKQDEDKLTPKDRKKREVMEKVMMKLNNLKPRKKAK